MRPGYSEHPEATDELLEAIRYHHLQRVGLGDDLADHVRRAIQEILAAPATWPPLTDWDGSPILRSREVGVCPYRVVYYARPDGVVIVAYAHERRRPGYWRRRLAR